MPTDYWSQSDEMSNPQIPTDWPSETYAVDEPNKVVWKQGSHAVAMGLEGQKETLIPGYTIQLCTDQELVGVRHRIKVEAKRLAEKAHAEEEEAFTKEEEEELGRMFADGWMRRKKPEVMQARKPAPKTALPPLAGTGFFSSQVAHFCNLVMGLQVLTEKVWRATRRLHWIFRLVITAPVSVLSVLIICPLAPVMLLLFAASFWLDLAYQDPKAWLKMTIGLIVGGVLLILWWSFLTSGPYGFFLAVFVAFAVFSQSNN